MPTIVPSQVVALIDQVFPDARVAPKFRVYSGSAATLSAIVDLTENIPGELITISGEDYTDLVHGLRALAQSVTRWNQRGGDEPPNYIKDKNPVAVIREMLAKCPDQSPSPTTAELSFIPDAALRDSIRLDLSTANSALHNSEWKAATVLAGAVVEALLLWAIQNNSSQLASLSSSPTGPPDEWGLSGLTRVALALGIIKQSTADQARLAANFRNLIHPGRAQRLQEVCDRGTALTALAAAELTIRDLS
jgi:hypothetical protein